MNIEITKANNFYEIFDWDSKTTLFVNEDKNKCIREIQIIKALGVGAWLSGMSDYRAGFGESRQVWEDNISVKFLKH